MDPDAAVGQDRPLGRIDAAQAHHADAGRIEHGWEGREGSVKAGQAQGIGHRHAMEVPAFGRLQRMEIGMGVEPEHEKLAAAFAGPARMARQRAGRQAVIAAEHDGQTLRARFIDLLRQRLGPGHDLRQGADRGIGVGNPTRRCRDDVAVIDHGMPQRLQRRPDPGGAKRARSHFAAEAARPVLHRRAQKIADGWCHRLSPSSEI